MRGNVLDMAIGVVMGTAFTAIVNSMVKDIFTPIISAFTGLANFENLHFTIGTANIAYGNFLNTVISFVIISFSIFCMMQVIGKLMKEKQTKEAESSQPTLTKEELLLIEIRDLLKESKNSK